MGTHQIQGCGTARGRRPLSAFTIAGKQLGATDERDLFAWAIELCGRTAARAPSGECAWLSMPRFGAYRQHVLDRLRELGYIADWKLLHASDYGVPQLRPRFVLVALRPADAPYFEWPAERPNPPTVGTTLLDLMESDGWRGAKRWAQKADKIAPTIVGGSKKHGGADLGPTRAKRAWLDMGVDALGVANGPPSAATPEDHIPKLTTEMVARIQGWEDLWGWEFTGRKTSRYRQIGNAFPPPVAEAVGTAIRNALLRIGDPRELMEDVAPVHDPVYRVLRERDRFVSAEQIITALRTEINAAAVERHVSLLSKDFHIEVKQTKNGPAYRIGAFKAFIGQDDHTRHDAYLRHLAKIS